MLLLEILVIIVLVAFVANGYRAGGVETLGRVVGALFGFLLARAFAGGLAGAFAYLLPENWAYTVAFLLIFLIANTLIGWLFKLAGTLLKIFTRLPIIKQIDHILGAAFGVLEGILVIGGTSWLLTQSAVAAGSDMITTLHTMQFMSHLFESLLFFLL